MLLFLDDNFREQISLFYLPLSPSAKIYFIVTRTSNHMTLTNISSDIIVIRQIYLDHPRKRV